MTTRVRFITLTIILISLLMIVSAVSFVAGAPLSQLDPTQQQQTIDVEVQRLLQATQEAEQILSVTQTIQAAFASAQTATAAHEGAVQTQLSRALTATAVFQVTIDASLQQYVQATAIARQGLEPISSQNACRLQPLGLVLMPNARVFCPYPLNSALTERGRYLR